MVEGRVVVGGDVGGGGSGGGGKIDIFIVNSGFFDTICGECDKYQV